ncbi:hypothetical protein BKA70DRAFT_202299 [Coprinopsis sp. MPI-PUGE-AT-0042]|nr:hypothetical protein BKA70DRAFT_202299 [Coprinopsis sp. MPI-PUGE-AT-0042]
MSTPIDILSIATPKHLTNPTPAQIDEAAALLKQAFKGDPLTPIFTANDPELDILLFKAGIGSSIVGGALHVLVVPASSSSAATGGANEQAEERIIGVAVWYPPGMTSNATPEQRAAGWDTFLETAERKNPKLKTWWLEYFIPNLTKTYASVLPENFTKDSWHLHLFGVLPAYHGKGLGKKLFKFAEDQARSTSSPIALETGTDIDIIIYRKLGLDVVGETKLESEHGTGKMTIMVRKWE